MRFAVDAEIDEFRSALAEVLEDLSTPEVIRAVGEDPAAAEPLASALAEFGLTGLLVAEDRDGGGMDENALVVLVRELGRFGVPLPVIETLAWAPGLAAEVDEKLVAGTWLGADVSGSGLVTAPTSELIAVGGFAGQGSVSFGTLAGGDTVDMVDPAAHAVRGAEVSTDVVVDDANALQRAWLRAAVAAAAALCGLMDRMITITVDYVKTREQFGKPIGSFQAIKHHLANAYLQAEFAWPAVLAAGAELAAGAPTAARSVSLAKGLASEAAMTVSKLCIQSHGAIAYTTEYDLHLYAKRAWDLAAAWGSAAWHRDKIGEALDLPASGNRPAH